MDHTEGQKADIRKSFHAKRRRQVMLSAPMFLLIAGLALMGKQGQTVLFGIEAENLILFLFLAIAGAIAFSLWNWRCPSCKGYLGKQTSPKFCSRCGVELQ